MKMANPSGGPVKLLILSLAFFLVFFSTPVFAKSDNANSGNGNGPSQGEHGNGNLHRVGGAHQGNSLRGEATATLARAHIHSSHYKHPGGVHADALYGGEFNGGDSGAGMTRVNGKGHHRHLRSGDSVVKNFETILDKMRAKHPEMLDPYGLVKDDRKELYGNRGRILHGEVADPPSDDPPAEDPPAEDPPAEDPPPDPEPDPSNTVTVTDETIYVLELMVWNGETVTRQLLTDLGYTTVQIDFLLTASITDLRVALLGGGTITF